MKKNERNVSWRLSAFYVAAFLFIVILIVRLVGIQLVDREKFEMKAHKQYKYEVKLAPERGKILDRKRELLAFNVPTISVTANPKEVENPYKAAVRLASVLNMSIDNIYKKLRSRNDFVFIARRQPAELASELDKLDIKGINYSKTLSRKYPKNRSACQLVGYTDIDGNGLSGIELAFEKVLTGVPGRAIMQKTGKSMVFTSTEYPLVLPANGQDITLTIDYRYQYIAEQQLRNTILDSKAESGIAIVMDPRTSEVLAMASEPSFDPNRPGEFSPESWRLRPITDQFEPGSTFKVAVMAALLDEGLKKPIDIVYCENGKYKIHDETIHDTSPHGWLTLREVLYLSSNIGMSKLAMDVDKNVIYRYARDFGFGVRTGIELKGEIDGVLKHPKDWSGVTPAAMSIGHEVAVTPLQLCNLYCTIANGGYLNRPTIIKEFNENGRRVMSGDNRFIRRAIKKTTSDTLKSMMFDVVDKGTGKKAAIPGMQVCGKTGTARMVLSGGRGYVKGKYFASFGGFFPKDDPKLCIFVMVKNPRGLYYGGDVAAPCFKRIAEEIISYEGLDYFQSDESIPNKLVYQTASHKVPNLIGFDRETAFSILQAKGCAYKSEGRGEVVLGQDPSPGSLLSENTVIKIKTGKSVETEKTAPRVVGLPVRNALNLLAASGMRAHVEGNGVVVRQTPAPGMALDGDTLKLECESKFEPFEILSY